MLFPLRNPAVVLAALMQVLPIVRTFISNPATASTVAFVLRWTLGTTAAVGAFDSVSGATSVFTSPSTFSGSVGTYFSNNVVVSIGGGNTAAKNDYFILSAGTVTSPLLLNGQSTTLTLPPGLTFQSSWVNGAKTIGGYIYGTPTTAGSYPTTITVVSPGNASLSQKVTITISGNSGPIAPTITSPPVATSVTAGNSATFTVTASGTGPLGYFWLKNGNPLANAGNISGANTATLTIASASAADAVNYSVIVSNSVSTVTSAAVALTVVMPPAITSQPVPQTATAGATTTFSVTATGSAPLAYRWLKNNAAIANGTKYSGVTTSVLTVTAVATADAGNYSVIVTNLAGSVTSSSAVLTVVTGPTITTPPASLSVIAGAGAAFSVTAAGSTPLYYQWLKNGAPLANGGNISGAATATLNLAAVTAGDAANYSVVVSNGLGSVTSPSAMLTVAVPPAIVTSPSGATLLAGSNITFSVTASGTGPLSFQWFKNGNALASGGNVSGATSAALTLANVAAADAGNYTATVTNAVGSATSAVAALTVLVPPAFTASPASVTVSPGNSASFSATATGTAPLSFQWLRNGTGIPGATGNVLSFTTVTTNDAGSYSVIVTNLAGKITSPGAVLTVALLMPPNITSQPANATVTEGGNASFTVVAGGAAPLTYQWRKNGSPLADAGNLAGATAATLNLANVTTTDAGNYSVLVSNTDGTATSSAAVLTVLTPPSIVAQPADLSGTPGGTLVLSVSASGTAPLSYQWFNAGGALADGGNISGSKTASLTLTALSTNAAGRYYVVVGNPLGNVSSAGIYVSVPVNNPPAITTQPASQTVAASSNGVFTVTATGSEPMSYQWRRNGKNLHDGGNISGTMTATLAIANLTTKYNGNYSVVVKNGLGNVTSASASLTVVMPPVFTKQAGNRNAKAGATTKFSANVKGTAPMSYHWFKDGSALTDGGNISGSLSPTLTVANLTTNDSGDYSLVASNFAGTATSSDALLNAFNPPVIVAQPGDESIVLSNQADFYVQAAGGGLHYQWRKGGKAISGATNATYTISSVSAKDDATYSVIIANYAGKVTSSNAKLSVLLPPVFTVQAGSRTATRGGFTTFTAAVKGTAPFYYQWFKNGVSVVNGGNISGATSNVLTIASVSSKNAGTYSLAVSNLAGYVTSAAAVLTVNYPSDNVVVNNDATPAATASIGTTLPPVISQIIRNADGSITLISGGTAGTSFILQGSPNLVDWTELQTQSVPENGIVEFTDTDAASLDVRFYRLAVP